MRKLTDDEIEEIINIAYTNSQKYILDHVNKKDFENIVITINLNPGEDCFDIDIEIDLDSDVRIPDNLAQEAVDCGLKAVDEYVTNLN